MFSTRPTWISSKLRARRQAPSTRGPVLVHQAQELLRLAQLRPREGAGEQLGHEPPGVVADLVGLADHPLGIAHRVGASSLG